MGKGGDTDSRNAEEDGPKVVCVVMSSSSYGLDCQGQQFELEGLGRNNLLVVTRLCMRAAAGYAVAREPLQ